MAERSSLLCRIVSRRVAEALALAGLMCMSRPANAVTLEIPTLTLRNTSIVRFTARAEDSTIPPDVISAASPVQTQDNTYQIRVPLRSIPWSDGCLCFGYTFIVENSASHERTVFDVRATPAGVFNETVTDVSFVVVDGSVRHPGVVALPVASYRSESPVLVLEPDNPDTFGHVRMSGQQNIDVKIKNTSDRFTVTAKLDRDYARVDTAGDLFTSAPQVVAESAAVILKPLEVRTVRIAVSPKPLSAIAACLLPTRAKAADGRVTLSFDYQVGPFTGDRPSFFSAPIDVRFEPNFYWLLLTLIGGVALGAALRSLAAQTWSVRQYLRVAGLAFLCALATDLIAMLLASSGSALVLFNYSINPSQLLPVAAIGMLCGLNGSAVLKWLTDTLRPPIVGDPQRVT